MMLVKLLKVEVANVFLIINTPLRWKFAKGHEWTANFHSIKKGKTWCSTCSDTRLNISIAKELVHSKNGECLPEEYINNRSPLLWRCDKGHEWIANLMKIKNHGSWCPGCRRVKPLNLEIAKQIAHDKNGECLSTKYKNCDTNLLWRCTKGHEWIANLMKIKNHGSWCPGCRRVKPLNLEIAKQIAHDKNGECLSTKYKNCDTNLLWRCTKGHEWNATLSNIKRGRWCPHCIGVISHTLEDAKQIAYNRNGKMSFTIMVPKWGCLSTEYINTRSDLLWQFINGHLWNAPLFNIKVLGTWCPYCKNKHEELNIYYPKYGFAIEVQGQQHEKYIEFFHRGDPNNFIKQKSGINSRQNCVKKIGLF
ncbi:hypothetical protein Glove_82g83 [Diversispora epigaea]|uniref:Treble clef zinc finger domain-containing protein n=1 Tax=Diversispora epigaea TaxID=1348612 RepID=A0A397JA88_9GLOM|nr:hypothetical protein Glove_82g83 [Diversispora epigaea]